MPIGGDFEVSHYLHYQGHKLVDRFDANTYLTITEAMDRHDVAAGRGSAAAALAPFRGPVLCLGIDSDVLYPTWQQREIVERCSEQTATRRATSRSTSPHGHDAFLIEWDAMSRRSGRSSRHRRAHSLAVERPASINCACGGADFAGAHGVRPRRGAASRPHMTL